MDCILRYTDCHAFHCRHLTDVCKQGLRIEWMGYGLRQKGLYAMRINRKKSLQASCITQCMMVYSKKGHCIEGISSKMSPLSKTHHLDTHCFFWRRKFLSETVCSWFSWYNVSFSKVSHRWHSPCLRLMFDGRRFYHRQKIFFFTPSTSHMH